MTQARLEEDNTLQHTGPHRGIRSSELYTGDPRRRDKQLVKQHSHQIILATSASDDSLPVISESDYPLICINFLVRLNKKNCLFPVTRPTLFFTCRPIFFLGLPLLVEKSLYPF